MAEDLLGDVPKKKAKATLESSANGAGGRLVARWVDGYVLKFGIKADPRQVGRLGKELKQLATAWGEAEVEALVDLFFATTDAAVVRSDYSPAAFLGLVPRLRIKGHLRASERTRENVDAATRAMERRR